MIKLEPIESTIISHRGYDPEQGIMQIRFKAKNAIGSLYEYGNISPELYAEGCNWTNSAGQISFGGWFQRVIKPNKKQYPYRQIEQQRDLTPEDVPETTMDFTVAGQPISVETQEQLDPIPEDIEEVKTSSLALVDKAKLIISINSPEAFKLAAKTVVTIKAVREVLKKKMYEGEDGIAALHKSWKDALAIFNFYDNPLEQQYDALRRSMESYVQRDRIEREAQARRIREQEQKKAEDDARRRAEELKIEDALAAEQAGHIELAEHILSSPALPVAPVMAAPVHIPSAVPQVEGIGTKGGKWLYEWVDKDGKPITEPDLNLIPREYLMVDEKAIGGVVRSMKGRTAIPGVRAYQMSSIRVGEIK